MAHKSKTQRAKASAAKANKKDRQQREEAAVIASGAAADADEAKKVVEAKREEASIAERKAAAAVKKEDKPKKSRFQFLQDVRAEMKRVTWPTRTDVARWSGVVVGALVFFGVYVAVLDNVIITPALVAITGLGA